MAEEAASYKRNSKLNSVTHIYSLDNLVVGVQWKKNQ